MKPKIPKINVFTKSGSTITDRDGNPLSNYVANFVYEFDETGDDDLATIELVLPMKLKYIMDYDSLAVDSQIKVSWGYVNGRISNTRLVAIRDYDTTYGKNGIRHILKCSDLLSYTKATQTMGNLETLTTFSAYLNRLLKGQVKVVSEVDLTPLPGTHYSMLDVWSKEALGLQNVDLPDNTRIGLDYIKKFAIVLPTGKSDFHNIKDNVESVDGNYTITGRDDELKIQQETKPNQVISHSYGIDNELGENVLAFMPESKFKSNDIDVNQDVNVDPETGDIVLTGTGIMNNVTKQASDQKESYTLEDKNWVGGRDYDGGGNIDDTYDPNSRFDPAGNALNPGTLYDPEPAYPTKRDIAKKVVERFYEALRETAEKAATSTDGTIWSLGDDNNNFVSNGLIARPIPLSILLKSPNVKPELAQLSRNILARKEYKKRKMVLRVVGDPTVESDQSILITGAAAIHNGKYYLQKVTHKVDSNGYITLQEGIKVDLSQSTINQVIQQINETGSFTDVEELYDVVEQYITYPFDSPQPPVIKYDAEGNLMIEGDILIGDEPTPYIMKTPEES